MEASHLRTTLNSTHYNLTLSRDLSSPMPQVLLSEKPFYRNISKLASGLDSAVVKAAQVIYSPKYAETAQNPDKREYMLLSMMDYGATSTIESYMVDKKASKSFAIEDLEKDLDAAIELAQKVVENPSEENKYSPFEPNHLQKPIRKFIFHLYSRIAWYDCNIPDDISYKCKTSCYFDKDDNLKLCTRDDYEKNYEFATSDRRIKAIDDLEECLHILQVFRRLLEKDKPAREKDPQSVLKHLTEHVGYEIRYKIERLKTLSILIGATACTSFACFKLFRYYYPD